MLLASHLGLACDESESTLSNTSTEAANATANATANETITAGFFSNPVNTVAASALALGSLALIGFGCHRKYQAQVANKTAATLKAQAAAEQAALLKKQNEAAQIEEARKIDECRKVQSFELRNEAKLKSLNITQSYIPLSWPSYAKELGFKTAKAPISTLPAPIFDPEKTKELGIVANMIKIVVAGKSGLALPNLVIQGAEGTGKSAVLTQLMHETDAGYVVIPKAVFENHIINGTHIQAFHQIQQVAMTSTAPVYLIIEDGEELFKYRPSLGNATETAETTPTNVVEQRRVELVNAFLDVTGDDDRSVSILLTTRYPERIDPAFNTRIKPIKLEAPNSEVRRAIITEQLNRVFAGNTALIKFFNLSRIEDMALRTEGFTGKDLKMVLEKIGENVTLKQSMGQNIDQGIIDSTLELLKNTRQRG